MTKTQKNILFGLLALLIVSLISAIWWGVFASLRGEGSKTETSTSTTEVITDNKDQEVCETKVDGLWNKTIQECDIAFTLEEVKEESEGISLSYQLPRFKEASITAFFERHMKERLEEFRGTGDLREEPLPAPYEFSSTVKIFPYRGSIKTIVLESNYYTGGAHGSGDVMSFVFDLNTGKQYTISEILQEHDMTLTDLSEGSRKQLRILLADDLKGSGTFGEDWILEGTKPDPDNFIAWVPLAEGIRITFNPYQVAPYVSGFPEVTVSWKE